MFNRSKSSPFRGKRRKRFTSKIDNLVFSGRKSEDTYQKMAEPHGQQPQNKAQYRVCGKRPELVWKEKDVVLMYERGKGGKPSAKAHREEQTPLGGQDIRPLKPTVQ